MRNEHTHKWFLQISAAALVIFLVALQIQAAEVPSCDEPPSFVGARREGSVDYQNLPKKVLVARSVDVWWSNPESGLKVFGSHNFQFMKTEIRCTQSSDLGLENSDVYALAMIDFSDQKKWGDSLWQIHLLADLRRSGFWPQKTRLAPIDEAQSIVKTGIWRQLDLNTIELIYTRNKKKDSSVIRILYDVMSP